MECVGFVGQFCSLYFVGFMAIEAGLGSNAVFYLLWVALTASHDGFFILRRVVVAVKTAQAVTCVTGVHLVVKQYLARIGPVRDPNWCFRLGYGEGSVTYDGDQQQVDRYCIGYGPMLL